MAEYQTPTGAVLDNQGRASKIANAYQQYLGREASSEELMGWYNRGVKKGTPWRGEDIVKGIQGSDEAKVYGSRYENPTYFQQKLEKADKNYESPVDMYNQLTESLGLADVRTRVTDLRGALQDTESMIKGVEQQVAGATTGTRRTSAQVQRMVQLGQEPLAELYGEQVNALDLAQGEYGMLREDRDTQAQLAWEGQKEQHQNLLTQLQMAIDNAQTKEDKRRWQKEYDLQLKQFKADQKQFEKEFAESQRQFNEEMSFNRAKEARIGSGRGGGGGGGSELPSIQQALVELFSGYQPAYEGGKAWHTEREIIPQLMSAYNLSKEEASKLAYKYRKEIFGEGY